MHDEVYKLACTWYSYIPPIKKDKIYEIYGFNEIPAVEENIQSDGKSDLKVYSTRDKALNSLVFF